MPAPDLESTALLLARIKQGDAGARERLMARYLPILRRWSHGRLPGRARQLADTEDLVQVVLVRALNRLETFEPRHEGAFVAYLRRGVLNAVRQEIRRTARRTHEELDPTLSDGAPSPLEQAIGRDMVERYEAELAALPEELQEAVILRIEMDLTYREIATILGKPSPDAARMAISRGLLRLAQAMGKSR